ncbi:hypothetical protein ZWY2020_033571 [Hordeum vulgare]|nr:hypothetical protein ZWY2020_033571 [Hordeum vulgare]
MRCSLSSRSDVRGPCRGRQPDGSAAPDAAGCEAHCCEPPIKPNGEAAKEAALDGVGIHQRRGSAARVMTKEEEYCCFNSAEEKEEAMEESGRTESSDETDATTTTEDDPLAGDEDLMKEEQEQAQQIHLSEQQSALTAPSEDAVSVEACVLAPEPLLGSPRPPPLLLSSEAAAVMPEPARVSAPDPMATPPRARAALTPEPQLGVRAPEKKEKGSVEVPFPSLHAIHVLLQCVFAATRFSIMSNTALSRAPSFLSVQESHHGVGCGSSNGQAVH